MYKILCYVWSNLLMANVQLPWMSSQPYSLHTLLADVNTSWENWIKRFMEVMNECIPQRLLPNWHNSLAK